MTPIVFQRGDVVVHPRRLEWGEGTVDQVTTIEHEGKPAQRIVVRFSHQGVVTLNTGIAPIVHKDSFQAMSSSTTTSGSSTPAPAPAPGSAATSASGTSRQADRPSGYANKEIGWLDAMAPKKSGDELVRLSDTMTDPFLSFSKRLQATLDAYRLGADARNGRSLLDWAIAQTGLHDPLTKYTRHDLEQAFPRYVRERDNNLFEIVRAVKRSGSNQPIDDALRATRIPEAREALLRAMKK